MAFVINYIHYKLMVLILISASITITSKPHRLNTYIFSHYCGHTMSFDMNVDPDHNLIKVKSKSV